MTNMKAPNPRLVEGCECKDCQQIRRAQSGHHEGCTCVDCRKAGLQIHPHRPSTIGIAPIPWASGVSHNSSEARL